MIFQLAFNGEIPSGQRSQCAKKHEIRRTFSVYLRKLWEREDTLRRFVDEGIPTVPYPVNRSANDDPEHPFYKAQSCGFEWLPLVTKRNRLGVELNIEILSENTQILKATGDLDNRLKVVLDALRMIRQPSELTQNDYGKGDEPMFVLLEDDSLIRKLEVEAVPSLGSPVEHRLTVDVKLISDKLGWGVHDRLTRI